MVRLFAPLAALLAMTAPLSAWECRNYDLEVTCDSESCRSSETFTPMDIAFAEDGRMVVCAYSGCWEGKANQIVRSDDYLILAASALRWSGGGQEGASIAVLLDKRSGIAVLNGAGFAHPLHCVR